MSVLGSRNDHNLDTERVKRSTGLVAGSPGGLLVVGVIPATGVLWMKNRKFHPTLFSDSDWYSGEGGLRLCF